MEKTDVRVNSMEMKEDGKKIGEDEKKQPSKQFLESKGI